MAYKDFRQKIAEDSKSSVYSRTTLGSMMNEFINDPDYKVQKFVPNGDDKFVIVESQPGKEFREGLKGLAKAVYGVDNAELDKLDDATISKKVTDPMLDSVIAVESDYMKAGKSLKFPATSEDDATMQVGIVKAAGKTEATRKIVETSPGQYESIPTGVEVTYKERNILKATNKTPGWLKSTKPIK